MTNRWKLEEALGLVHLLEEVGGRLVVVERLGGVEGVPEGVDDPVGQVDPGAVLSVGVAPGPDDLLQGGAHAFQELDGLQGLPLEGPGRPVPGRGNGPRRLQSPSVLDELPQHCQERKPYNLSLI